MAQSVGPMGIPGGATICAHLCGKPCPLPRPLTQTLPLHTAPLPVPHAAVLVARRGMVATSPHGLPTHPRTHNTPHHALTSPPRPLVHLQGWNPLMGQPDAPLFRPRGRGPFHCTPITPGTHTHTNTHTAARVVASTACNSRPVWGSLWRSKTGGGGSIKRVGNHSQLSSSGAHAVWGPAQSSY